MANFDKLIDVELLRQSWDRKYKKFGLSQNIGFLRSKDVDIMLKDLSKVRLSSTKWKETYNWCESNVGDNWIWSNPVMTDWMDIYFVKSEDAVVFKLLIGVA